MSNTKTDLPTLLEQATQNQIAPGLRYFKLDRGEMSGYFQLTSPVLSASDAEVLVDRLNKQLLVNNANNSSQSLEVKMLDLIEKSPEGTDLGKLVTISQFHSVTQAQDMQQDLAEKGFQLRASHSSQRSGGMGKQAISILKLVPSQYTGALRSFLAEQHISGVEKTSVIAKRNQGIAAVNGGFFAFNPSQGVIGDVAGIGVINGTLVSEAVAGRPALLIKNKPSLSVDILTNVQSHISLTVEEEVFHVDGINRLAGKIFNCGFDHPKVVAIHDYVCHKADEIIVYNHFFGGLNEVLNNSEFYFFVDENDAVYFNLANTSEALPKGHRLVVASGDSASKLTKHISPAVKVAITQRITSDSGELRLSKGMYLVNGGPTLLIDGKQPISQRSKQGWGVSNVDNATAAIDARDEISPASSTNNRVSFYQNWVLQRHPRTAVGVTETGDVYVVVVYGRDPFKSIGASITEMSELMLELGVQKAINLDGGGSSVMVVNGQITGKPSDKDGERAVAEALIFTANKKV
ncbi:phosphodiester glycosidase family protein [Aliiglaciecola aliphaticivorans]